MTGVSVCALVLVLLTGCASNGLKDMIEALAKDPATVCAKIVYGPAVIQIYRTNAQQASVKCTNDGLDVETIHP